MMTALKFTRTGLAGVWAVARTIRGDERGSFARLFCASTLAQHGWNGPIAQVNLSTTARCGAIRGLHFQLPPDTEYKLVSCTRGRVFDVAVDIRAGSPTLLRWHGTELSAARGDALLIPPGCAHGFQTLTDDVELVYCHSRAYAPTNEGGLDPLDPRLAIAWPEAPGDMSARDRGHPAIGTDYQGVTI